jgi:O-antigen/teichoic acid export membrane protein
MPSEGAVQISRRAENPATPISLSAIAAQPPLSNESQQFRSHVGEISRQSGVFFAGTIFTAAAGYAFKVYLARVLGAEGLGIYALGMTVAGLFGIFGGLGLNSAALRFPAAYAETGRTQELGGFIARSVLILVGVNGLLAGGVVVTRHWVALHLYHTPALAGYLYLFALMLFLGQLTAFFSQLLAGYKAVAKRTIITNFAGVSLTILFTIILIWLGTGLWGYIFAQVASASVVLLLLIGAAYRRTPPAARPGFAALHFPQPELFAFASAAFAMDIVGFLYSQTDKIILGSYLNARSVGIYAVAASVVAFVPIALQSVNQIFSSTIAELHARGEMQLLNRLFQTLTKWVTGLTFPLAVAVIVYSRVLMRIFGSEFEAGWVILVIGTVGQFVNCATGSVGYLLLMSGNQKRLVRIQIATGVLTVISCVVLVARWGIVGAAIAAAFGNVSTNMWCLLEVRKALRLFPYNRSYWSLALPAIVTVAAALGLRMGLRNVKADIAVLAVSMLGVYAAFSATVLLQGLDADDRLIASAIGSRIADYLPISARAS